MPPPDDQTHADAIVADYEAGKLTFELAVLKLLADATNGIWSVAWDVTEFMDAMNEDDTTGKMH